MIILGVVMLQGSSETGQRSAAVVPRAASARPSPPASITATTQLARSSGTVCQVRLVLARIARLKFTQISAGALLNFDTGLVQLRQAESSLLSRFGAFVTDLNW